VLSRIKEIRYDYVSSGWIGMSLWESLGQQFVVAESLSFEERQQLTRLGWLSLSGAGTGGWLGAGASESSWHLVVHRSFEWWLCGVSFSSGVDSSLGHSNWER